MRNLFAAGAMLALLGACNSQNDEPAPREEIDSGVAAAATPGSAASSITQGVAATPAEALVPADLAPGDWVEVTRLAQCHEVGPNADDSPWDMYPGVTKEIVAVEGDRIRVKVADVECLLPVDAVKRS